MNISKGLSMKEKVAIDSAFVATLGGGYVTLHDVNELLATAGGVVALLIAMFRLLIVIREWRGKK